MTDIRSRFEERIAKLNEKLFRQLLRKFSKADVKKHLQSQKDPLFITNQLTKLLTSGGPMNIDDDLAKLSMIIRSSNNSSKSASTASAKESSRKSATNSGSSTTKSCQENSQSSVTGLLKEAESLQNSPLSNSLQRRPSKSQIVPLPLPPPTKPTNTMAVYDSNPTQGKSRYMAVKTKRFFHHLAPDNKRKGLPARPSSAPQRTLDENKPDVVHEVDRRPAVKPLHSLNTNFFRNDDGNSQFMTETKLAYHAHTQQQPYENIARNAKHRSGQIFQREVDCFPTSTAHESFGPIVAFEKPQPKTAKGQGTKSEVRLVDNSVLPGQSTKMCSLFQDSYKTYDKSAYLQRDMIITNSAQKPQHDWLDMTDGIPRVIQKATTMSASFRPFSFATTGND
jgi:hypothetical protein